MLFLKSFLTWKIPLGMDRRVERLIRPPSLSQICPTNLNFLVETVVVVDGVVVDGAVVVVAVVFVTPF